jgi:hypothetical protein
MTLEKIQLEHVPSNIHVYAALFRDVTNADFLQSQLLARNPDFEFAFIDASSVISRLHVLSAVYAAINSLLTGTLRTPNVHSETVVSFNTNNNVFPTPFPFCAKSFSSHYSPSPDRRRLPPLGYHARQNKRPDRHQNCDTTFSSTFNYNTLT